MKRTAVFFMSLMCVFSLSACGNGGQKDSASESISENVSDEGSVKEIESEASNNHDETVNAEENKETENVNGKILVVYYSASGYTEAVAGYIAEAADADIFKIEPVNVYTDADLDWTNQESRVVYEHDNPDARNVELVSTEVTNWDSYDTVFIGYPIWWGEAAWVVDNFVKENDFTDKTVIPFCTSSSSSLGESGELLAEMAGTGNWQNGERFRSRASEDDVKNWVSSLNLN